MQTTFGASTKHLTQKVSASGWVVLTSIFHGHRDCPGRVFECCRVDGIWTMVEVTVKIHPREWTQELLRWAHPSLLDTDRLSDYWVDSKDALCTVCNLPQPDVCERVDMYLVEVYEYYPEEAKRKMCADCEKQRREDV